MALSFIPSSSSDQDGVLIAQVESSSKPGLFYEVWRFGRRRDEGGRGTKWSCLCPSRKRPCKHLLAIFDGTVRHEALRFTAEGAAILLPDLERKWALPQPGDIQQEITDQHRRPGVPTLFTIGHGNRSTHELFSTLRNAGATLLCDVRSFPNGRWTPQFRKPALEAACAADPRLLYRHMPELGGYNPDRTFPKTKDARWWAGIDNLIRLARDGVAVAVMCMETNFQECHRYLQIVPDVLARAGDIDVIHLPGPRKVLEAGLITQTKLEV